MRSEAKEWTWGSTHACGFQPALHPSASHQPFLPEHLPCGLQALASDTETALEGLFIQPPQQGGVHNCISQFLVISPKGSDPLVEPWLIQSWTRETGQRWCCCRDRSDSANRENGMSLRYTKDVENQDLMTHQIWQWGVGRGQGWPQRFQVGWLGWGVVQPSGKWSRFGREGDGELSWDYSIWRAWWISKWRFFFSSF